MGITLATAETITKLHFADISVIVLYLIASLVVGLWFARKGTKSMSEFFVGGRQMAWWLAGASIIATSFAADTPLWIGDMIYRRGIEGTWLHWAPGIGAAFYVFIIAPLWRRSAIMTDLELLELRYNGGAARWIRGFSSCYYAFFWNIMMMAVGILSIATLMESMIGMPKMWGVLITIGTVMIYSTVSGIWGVCSTDLLQLIVYIFGSTALAFYSVHAAGGVENLIATVKSLPDWSGRDLNIMPRIGSGGLPLMTIIFLFSMRWLEHTNWGYFVSQRLCSTKSAKYALFAALLWVIVYWSIIPFPWIVTILSAKVVLPQITNGQEAYPRMAMAVLPIGLKGLFIVSMLAAFMSTFSSLLNWGSSYVINDLYQRFMVKKSETKHYVYAGQIVMIPMGIAATLIALYSESILNLLFYVLMAGIGSATVRLMRWLWWRVNAWSEIAGLVGSLFCTALVCIIFPQWVKPENLELYFGHRMIFVVVGTLVIWLAVTWLTPAVEKKTLEEFFKKVRPPGFWKPISKGLIVSDPPMSFKSMMYSWIIMLAAIYGPLVGLIKLFVGEKLEGFVFLSIGTVGVILAIVRAVRFKDDVEPQEEVSQ